MNCPKMIMLVGLPGSGKSTWAKQRSNQLHYEIFSSDAVRKELYGNESDQRDPQKVFQILHKRIRDALLEGTDCIYDATNLSSKTRRNFLQYISDVECFKMAYVIWSDFNMCLVRNKKRERKVPEDVIKRMLMRFEMPAKWEGFDVIHVFYMDTSNPAFTRRYYTKKMRNFAQENPHHSLCLGNHCDRTANYLSPVEVTTSVLLAARWHDIGKLFTKTYDENGCAHYYNHHNVGAYVFLGIFSDYSGPLTELYEATALITHHMAPYFWKEDKTREKYKSLWGEDFYDKIMRLHEADKAAH